MTGKDVFICYSFKDVDRTRRLKKYLEAVGLSCWMAPESIPAGASVTSAITQGIEESRVFLLVFSEYTRDSAWAKNEVRFALKKEETIIPFALDKCELTDDFGIIDKRSVIDGKHMNNRSLKKLADTIKTVLADPGDKDHSLSLNPEPERSGRGNIRELLRNIKRIAIICIVIYAFIVGAFVTLLEKIPYWFPDHSKDVSGATGEVEWTYVPSTHELIISGEGAVDDYTGEDDDPIPWKPYWNSIEKVTVKEGVTHIGSYAFFNLTRAKNITLPDTVESIGDFAFESTCSLMAVDVSRKNQYFCVLDGNLYDKDKTILIKATLVNKKEKIKLPGSVTSVAADAFCRCAFLEKQSLNNVKHLSDNAFHHCEKLTSVTLSPNTEALEGNPFSTNPSLSEIKVSGCTRFCAYDGVLYTKDMSELVAYPPGKTDTVFTVPDAVTVIGDYAFCKNEHLTTVEFPRELVSIGNGAFSDCSSLSYARLPDNLHTLGNGAFEYCNIQEASVPDATESIGDSPYMGNISLRGIRVSPQNPNFVSHDGVLYNKSMTELIEYPSGKETLRFDIPESVVSMNNGSFAYVGLLKQINFTDNVKTVGDRSFIGCLSLSSVSIPDSVLSVGEYAFARCRSMSQIDLPNKIDVIPKGSFFKCEKLTSIALPDSVTQIGYSAFSGCSALNHAELPNGMRTIGKSAFMNCLRLSRIDIPSSVDKLGRFSIGYFINENGLPELNCNITVSYTAGSAAEKYAVENGLGNTEGR